MIRIEKTLKYRKVNVPVLARVPTLARMNSFFGKIRKVVNVF